MEGLFFSSEIGKHEKRGLTPLLKSWQSAQREYNAIHTGPDSDFAWNYHERACVGFLAAAAWRIGGVALEEWRTCKGHGRKTSKGRCDLYLHTKEVSFHIEAKRLWINVNSPERIDFVQNMLESAQGDCGPLQCNDQEKLGVLFVTPYFEKDNRRNRRKQIRVLLGEFKTQLQPLVMAWLFDSNVIDSEEITKIAPGIVLLAIRPERKAIRLSAPARTQIPSGTPSPEWTG
jgi:hypothetical protein